MFLTIFAAITVVAVCVLFLICRRSDSAAHSVEKAMRILAVIYCGLVFVNIFFPDGFVISLSEEEALGSGLRLHALLRWFGCVAFVALPLAAFTKKAVFRRIALFFCLPVAIISVITYADFVVGFLSETGRGISTIRGVSDGVKLFFRNETFRVAWSGLMWLIAIIIPIGLSLSDGFAALRREEGNSVLRIVSTYFLVLVGLLILLIPIYVPQYLIGYTTLIFNGFDIVQLVWLILIAVIIAGLYLIFRKRSQEDKYLLCVAMALGLLLQYNSFFGAIGSITFLRLPFQLCNIGSYLVLAALLTRNKALFDFTYIVNVAGAFIAMAVPDVDGEGIGYLWNVHFIVEHTWVLVTPVLALALGVFPRLKREALKHFLIGFTAYFGFVLIVGTLLNGVAAATGDDFFNVNYLFMFDAEPAEELLGVGELFDIGSFSIGSFTLRPVIQSIVFCVLNAVCLLFFGGVQLYYSIADRVRRKSVTALPLESE